VTATIMPSADELQKIFDSKAEVPFQERSIHVDAGGGREKVPTPDGEAANKRSLLAQRLRLLHQSLFAKILFANRLVRGKGED
jgi:hypothetical protein